MYRSLLNLCLTPTGTVDVEALLAASRARYGNTKMDTTPDGGGAGGTGGGTGAGTGAGAEGGTGTGGAGGAGAAGAGTGTGTGAGTGGAGTDGADGFPPNTPVVEMTTAQQAAYWKYHSRKHEAIAKDRGDYDDLKQKAEQFDALQAASATEQEKAVAAAKAEGRAEALPGLVRAEFKAAAAGRLDANQLKTILDPLDLSKFLTAKGEVDEAKVQAYVDGIAPARPGGRGTAPDLGQGRRGGGTTPTGGERGRAEAQKRFGNTAVQR